MLTKELTTASPTAEVRDAFAHIDHDAGALVAEHDGRREGDGAGSDGIVAVADAAGGKPDHDFAAARRFDLDFLDDDGLVDFAADDGLGAL
jgi:hypothetical protein